MRSSLYRIIHSIFAIAVTTAFLSAIFVAPLVSAGLVTAAVIGGEWSVWRISALGHLIALAAAGYVFAPAFRRHKFSST